MRPPSVVSSCLILIIVTITLTDASNKVNKGAEKKGQSNGKSGKLNNAGKVIKQKTTPVPKGRERKKTSTTAKIIKVTKKRPQPKAKSALDDIVESAPDIEAGIDCYDACFKNLSLFGSDGALLNPNNYGTYAMIKDKTFLLGEMQLSWADNWRTCCSIGMQPVIFPQIKETFSTMTRDKPEVIYWTGGFKHELNDMWSWCNKDSPEPMDYETDLQRSQGEDDFHCVAMVTGDQTRTSFISVSCDSNETSQNTPVFLACESMDVKPMDMMVGNPRCTKKCNSNHQCKRNVNFIQLFHLLKTHVPILDQEVLSKFNSKGENILKDRYSNSIWASKCGRYFMFSKQYETYYDARERCCALGMKLLSIKTTAKRKCLAKLTRDFSGISGEFWTSGTDLDCEGNYRWCSVDRAFLKHEINWAAGEPNSKRGHCVTVKTSGYSAMTTLQTAMCKAKKRYICEVRQSGITVEAVQKECISLIGLSDDEVNKLYSSNDYTDPMKCYLKCLGDNLGMLVNGTLREGNVFRLIRKYDASLNFDKGTNAVIKCKSEQVPTADECQNAYNLYKCVKEKAPDVFRRVIAVQKEDDAPVDEKIPVPVGRICKNNLESECRLNTSRRATFFKEGMTAEGGSAVTYARESWYKSERGAHKFADAFKYCCSLDMHLPVVRYQVEISALADWMGGLENDNFFDETYSLNDEEKWCSNHDTVDPLLSDDDLLVKYESTVYYLPKGFRGPFGVGVYNLKSIPYGEMDVLTVPYFFCQPKAEIYVTY